MNELELIVNFENGYGWGKVEAKLKALIENAVIQVRKNGKQSGHEAETAYWLGCLEAYELVSNLPSILKDEMKKLAVES